MLTDSWQQRKRKDFFVLNRGKEQAPTSGNAQNKNKNYALKYGIVIGF